MGMRSGSFQRANPAVAACAFHTDGDYFLPVVIIFCLFAYSFTCLGNPHIICSIMVTMVMTHVSPWQLSTPVLASSFYSREMESIFLDRYLRSHGGLLHLIPGSIAVLRTNDPLKSIAGSTRRVSEVEVTFLKSLFAEFERYFEKGCNSQKHCIKGPWAARQVT